MKENYIVQREHAHKEVVHAGRSGRPTTKKITSYQQAGLTIGKDEAVSLAAQMTRESGYNHRVVSVLDWEEQNGEVIARATPATKRQIADAARGETEQETPRRGQSAKRPRQRAARSQEPAFWVWLGRLLGFRKH